ncbi:MAG TPA: vitamin K epoxide reductase family protein [Draconibacterium sp.]|nr:vitamin K epoxide reductase family protein [Draconibacterium sp.]
MDIYSPKIPFYKKWPRWQWMMLGLNLLALILGAILSWHSLAGGSMAGCGGGSPCDQVLSSRWSLIAGILPVSGLALGAYLAILMSSFFIGSETEISLRRLVWSIMVFLSGAIVGSAIWFTILQKWIIGQFCIYCMTTHITGVILAVLIITRAIKERNKHNKTEEPVLKPNRVVVLTIVGMVLAGIMAVLQFSFTPSAQTTQSEESQNTLLEIDYSNAPIIGSPDAENIVTLLFDYQCAHCQKIHFMLGEVVRQYEGKLAFALCPTPLENSCNPYVSSNKTAFINSCELAKIGLAVWRANQDAFTTFETWMFTYDSGNTWKARSPEAAIQKAIELVGKENFEAASSDPWIEKYLQTSVRIFGQTIQGGRAAIPKMVYDSKWLIPEPYNADDLVTILQNSLGVPTP